MGKYRVVLSILVFTLVLTLSVGCGSKEPVIEQQTGWDTGTGSEVVDESIDEVVEEVVEEVVDEVVDEDFEEQFPVDDEEYAKVDMTLGRPMSSIYTYKLVPNKGKAREITPSTVYEGFFEARLDNGTKVLLGPTMEDVVYPESDEFEVLEPFTYGGNVYFRVQDLDTNWVPKNPAFESLWWKPQGGYAVVDSEGDYTIPFGMFQYLGEFVEGNARALSVEDDMYYIVAFDGTVVREFPIEEGLAPYKLFPDGYIYTRKELGHNNYHSHALINSEGDYIIPYKTFYDDFYPKYLGDGTFIINNDKLMDGSLSGLVLYAEGKEPRLLPKDSYDVFSAENNMFVTGMITNGLAGPLARWDYKVTDYAGDILVPRGRYDFGLGGWGDGYAVARRGNRLVLLDSKGREVTLPEHMELTGRYAKDAALFTVKVTKDFQMWRFPDVPSRYDNPVGIVDKDFNWVIPPGVIDFVRNLPVESVHNFSEYKQGDSEKNSLLHIFPVR